MWCTETCKWYKKESERGTWIVVKKLQRGDTLIITEVSRLSRKMMNIMNIIHQSIEKGITIHSIKEGYKFDSSINSQVFSLCFWIVCRNQTYIDFSANPRSPGKKKGTGNQIGAGPKEVYEPVNCMNTKRRSRNCVWKGFLFKRLPCVTKSLLKQYVCFTYVLF